VPAFALVIGNSVAAHQARHYRFCALIFAAATPARIVAKFTKFILHFKKNWSIWQRNRSMLALLALVFYLK